MSDDNKTPRPPLDKATMELLGNPPEDQAMTAAAQYNEEHAGGTVRIPYEPNCLFTAPYSDVADAVQYFRSKGTRERTQVMQSVNRSIAKLLPLVKARWASQEQFMLCAQDVAIWYANEVVEGRATLEQHWGASA